MRCISKTIVAEIVASKPGNPRNSEGDFIRLKDDGIHFGEACIIEDKPFAEYSYPAVFFTNEANALLAYTAGGEDESGGRSLESCPFCQRIVSVTLPDKG